MDNPVIAQAEPWRWQPHPEVWLLVASVVALWVYAIRVLGPHAVPPGQKVVTRRQVGWFVASVALLWVASDWPVHDLGEEGLFSIHMIQHLLMSLVLAPMVLLSIPEWLARATVPDGGVAYRIIKRLAHPAVAWLIVNGYIVLSHWSVFVNTEVRSGWFHYSAHVMLLTTGFIMWVPVCGPWKELRLTPIGQCVYLFMMSLVPTIPGAWMNLASEPVYEVYDHEPRLWGVSVMQDQQVAGLIMKVAGDLYLWGVIVVVFFRHALEQERTQRRNRLIFDPVTGVVAPASEMTDPAGSDAGGSKVMAPDLPAG